MGHIERRAHIYAALYWERVVSPQVRAHMMCAAGKALCDASQLALPTSDSLARQGGDSDPHASCTPPPASSRNMPSNALCGTAAVGAPHFGCSSVLREHLRTIRSACLVNSSYTQNTAPTEQRSRARVSRRLLCSPRDGLCSITLNKPTTSVTRHQLDTRDSVHSRQEPQARVNQRGPRACVGWGHTHALDCAGTDGFY